MCELVYHDVFTHWSCPAICSEQSTFSGLLLGFGNHIKLLTNVSVLAIVRCSINKKSGLCVVLSGALTTRNLNFVTVLIDLV